MYDLPRVTCVYSFSSLFSPLLGGVFLFFSLSLLLLLLLLLCVCCESDLQKQGLASHITVEKGRRGRGISFSILKRKKTSDSTP